MPPGRLLRDLLLRSTCRLVRDRASSRSFEAFSRGSIATRARLRWCFVSRWAASSRPFLSTRLPCPTHREQPYERGHAADEHQCDGFHRGSTFGVGHDEGGTCDLAVEWREWETLPLGKGKMESSYPNPTPARFRTDGTTGGTRGRRGVGKRETKVGDREMLPRGWRIGNQGDRLGRLRVKTLPWNDIHNIDPKPDPTSRGASACLKGRIQDGEAEEKRMQSRDVNAGCVLESSSFSIGCARLGVSRQSSPEV